MTSCGGPDDQLSGPAVADGEDIGPSWGDQVLGSSDRQGVLTDHLRVELRALALGMRVWVPKSTKMSPKRF